MGNTIELRIAEDLSIKLAQVSSTILLIDEGSTIPFISRYRKEQTGGLDEVQIRDIQVKYEELIEREKRKKFIIESIRKQDKLTESLENEIILEFDLTRLEDLYLPYKSKRKTRAEKARENGLLDLATIIFEQEDIDLEAEVEKYITESVPDRESALEGARDIIAEWINESSEAREDIRSLFDKSANISSTVVKSKKAEAQKFKDYFSSSEALSSCPSHRFLAMQRGMNEGYLRVSIAPPLSLSEELLFDRFLKNRNSASESSKQVELAIRDSYKRLLGKSIEAEFFKAAKEKADRSAIDVFVSNLRQLLLAAPLGQKRLLAVDPGFRTGCKVVVLGEQGELLENSVINLLGNSKSEAESTLKKLISEYKIEAIAIGNGTASRETEGFIRNLKLENGVAIYIVSEDGASVYSASDIAREEFPDKDVTVRGAISIGRRLMDPLAELVKIDPKSIGIGQYQHDVDQVLLKKNLDLTIESCVNLVGVDLNTASSYLLNYVSGLGPVLSKNIIEYRTINGPYTKRSDLKKVAKIGPKAFEQCAGFLRITGSKNPLDNSTVHPERYELVQSIANDVGITVSELIGNKEVLDKVDLTKYVEESVGLPTLQDVLNELMKPGVDPRGEVEVFAFKDGVNEIEDLEIGMKLPGVVTNITSFGAFIDIGVHCDGLLHISQLADKFVSDPLEIISLHEKLEVRVIEIDIERKRISLSLRQE
jgi:uncharacterized protein